MPRFIRSYKRFEQLCEEMRYLEGAVGNKLHFVVIGTSLPRRISRFLSEFSCSIVSAQPFSVAVRSGCKIAQDLKRDKNPRRNSFTRGACDDQRKKLSGLLQSRWKPPLYITGPVNSFEPVPRNGFGFGLQCTLKLARLLCRGRLSRVCFRQWLASAASAADRLFLTLMNSTSDTESAEFHGQVPKRGDHLALSA